jgi:hypothetical protein
MYPYNHKMGQKIQTDVSGEELDRSFLAHFQVAADDAVAPDNVGVHAAVDLGAEVQDIDTEITDPAVPRSLVVKGNASGIAGDVVINGTNFAGEEITETIALSGADAVAGSKAFKTVININLPAKTNAEGDTVSIGLGAKWGLPYMLSHDVVISAYLGNAREATVPTVAVSSTAIESNTISLNSALNGSVVDAYLMV